MGNNKIKKVATCMNKCQKRKETNRDMDCYMLTYGFCIW